MICGAKRKEHLAIIIVIKKWKFTKRMNILFTWIESLAIFIKRWNLDNTVSKWYFHEFLNISSSGKDVCSFFYLWIQLKINKCYIVHLWFTIPITLNTITYISCYTPTCICWLYTWPTLIISIIRKKLKQIVLESNNNNTISENFKQINFIPKWEH